LPLPAEGVGIPALSHLTQAEAQFVYNVETLGLPLKKASDLAGLPYSQALQPHIYEARDLLKRQMRGRVAITKEDVVHGICDAIDRAKIIAEPSTEIAGWKEINAMFGYNAPAKLDINIKASISAASQQVRTLSDAELVKMLGAGSVIDGDFYEVKEEA